MSITISNMSIPSGCQKCKFFKKYLFGNGLDYSYSCILGAKDFPMPWIRQMEERASDCPIEPLEQEPILDKIRAEIEQEIEQEKFARSIFRHEEIDAVKAEQCTGSIFAYRNVIKFIDKYKAESEE